MAAGVVALLWTRFYASFIFEVDYHVSHHRCHENS
jgi:hypothetical protein